MVREMKRPQMQSLETEPVALGGTLTDGAFFGYTKAIPCDQVCGLYPRPLCQAEQVTSEFWPSHKVAWN